MVSVRSVVDRVGPTLLHALLLPDDSPAVADVVIAEPGGAVTLAAGDLVLGVATTGPEDAAELVKQSAGQGAAAVLLKPPVAGKPAVKRAAKASGIALIQVHAATSWAQLVWLLRTVLDALADESEDLDPGSGDLFRLADAVASVVDAPVTIEDTNSRVLAYSARQDLTDPARVATIMGRRIPDDVLARFRSRGVFRELSRGRQTIFVPAQRDGTLPRLIVPIRMGGELLGSMWAVVAGPVSDERAAAFADAAPVVALHLLRRRAHTDAQRRASAELLRGVLEGRANPRKAMAELDLSDEPHRVVVIEVTGGDGRDAEGLRLALLERISQGIGSRPVATELGGLLYAVVPDRPGPGGWAELREALVATGPSRRSGAPRAAAGAPGEIGDLSASRAAGRRSPRPAARRNPRLARHHLRRSLDGADAAPRRNGGGRGEGRGARPAERPARARRNEQGRLRRDAVRVAAAPRRPPRGGARAADPPQHAALPDAEAARAGAAGPGRPRCPAGADHAAGGAALELT